MVSVDDQYEDLDGLFKEPILGPLNLKNACHLEYRLIIISQKKLSDFDEIWYTTADWNSMTVT